MYNTRGNKGKIYPVEVQAVMHYKHAFKAVKLSQVDMHIFPAPYNAYVVYL